MKTNERPGELMDAAWDKARSIYSGQRIRVRLRSNWREMTGRIETCDWSYDHFSFFDSNTGKRHNFYPSIHPHELLP